MNIYLYTQRCYEDEYFLRERGYSLSIEKSDILIYQRQLKIDAHILFLSTLQLNWREFKDQNVTSENFEIPLYKEELMRAYQISKYKKNKNKDFDYVFLAEKENF